MKPGAALINILLELMTGTSDLLPIRRNITVREAYFDAPVLDQLMMDVIANVSALCHWTKRAAPEAPGMWHGVHWWPDSEDRFKERSVIFPALVVVYAIRNPVISLAYLRYHTSRTTLKSRRHSPVSHQSHRGHSEHVDLNHRSRQRAHFTVLYHWC